MYQNELAQTYETGNPAIDDMAAVGRKGDTMMAHVTPGDYVIPKDILTEHPEFLVKLKKVMEDNNEDYRNHMVGSGYENINPSTGAPEFGFGKRFKRLTRSFGRGAGESIGKMAPASVDRAVGQIASGTSTLAPVFAGGLGAATAPTFEGVREGVASPESIRTVEVEKERPITEMALPESLREMGGLTDIQRRSYLASQGAMGRGLGGSARDYYINLLQRNIAAEQGDLLPVESQYLSSQGVAGDLRGQDLIEALRGI